jgi:cell division protein FtsL
LLRHRGVAISAAALSTALAGEAVTAAPLGLAISVSGAALTGAGAAGGIVTVTKIITMTKIKAGIISAVVVAGAAIPLWTQHQAQLKVREENRALQQEVEQLAADNQRLSNQVTQAAAAQVAEAARTQARAPKAPPVAEPAATAEDEGKLAGIAKMNYTKEWIIAFLLYSQKNQDQFPASFEQAAPFLREEAKAQASQPSAAKYGLLTDRFEIVYQGSIKGLASPQSVIVVREKEPWPQADGSWVRAYAFADGHSEIHRAVDGNFAPWEAQHMATPPAEPQAGQ